MFRRFLKFALGAILALWHLSRPPGKSLLSLPPWKSLLSRPPGKSLLSRPPGKRLLSRPPGKSLLFEISKFSLIFIIIFQNKLTYIYRNCICLLVLKLLPCCSFPFVFTINSQHFSFSPPNQLYFQN